MCLMPDIPEPKRVHSIKVAFTPDEFAAMKAIAKALRRPAARVLRESTLSRYAGENIPDNSTPDPIAP